MGIDLPVIWAVIIAFGLMMYVIMDGFDLGIGILFPFVGSRDDRDVMVNSVAPVWDGNETWLVMGGAALMAAFPLAYSVILSALYLPLVLMLLGLIWRGVAFEFRFKADLSHRPFWDLAFMGGSYRRHLLSGRVARSIPERPADAGWQPLPAALSTGSRLSACSPDLGWSSPTPCLACTWLIIKTEGAL